MRSLWMSACCLALAAPAAHAAPQTQVYFRADGNPALSAFVAAGEQETFVEWRQCDGATCVPVPDSAYERREPRRAVVSLGETPAGTTFEAVYSTATIRTRALRRTGRLTIGKVTCPSRCTVGLKVTGKFRTIRRHVSVTGAKALSVPVRHGRMNVRVTINGRLAAAGHTRAR
jgi:hypothetical protein